MHAEKLAHSLVLEPDARIILSGSDSLGRLPISHSARDSTKALERTPPGWSKSERLDLPDPEQPGQGTRVGWLWSKGETRVAVVPHEWGVEILIGIAAGVATEAILQLANYLWSQWTRQEINGGDEMPIMRMQVIRKTNNKGRAVQTLEISGKGGAQAIVALLKDGMALLDTGAAHNSARATDRATRPLREEDHATVGYMAPPWASQQIRNRSLPGNPLGMIALFVLLIEAIATISLKIVAEARDPGLLMALVAFIIVFPCAIAALFFLTLWRKREVLYGPMDFSDPSSFEKILLAIGRIETKQEVGLSEAVDALSEINRTLRQVGPPSLSEDRLPRGTE